MRQRVSGFREGGMVVAVLATAIVFALLDPTQDYPVTAFVTDANVEDVSAFFTELFGDPYPPSADSEERLNELSMQLIELQGAAAGGDQEAIKKLIALSDELTQVQQAASLQSYLQLPAIHAENDWVFLDGSIDDFAMSPARAVTVGEDALLLVGEDRADEAPDVVVLGEPPVAIAHLAPEAGPAHVHAARGAGVTPVGDGLRTARRCGPEEHDSRDDGGHDRDGAGEELHDTGTFRKSA